jgi:hypothetical protein
MTIQTPESNGGQVAIPDEFNNIGLEDVGATDVVIPRLSIVHKEAEFKNNLSGEQFPVLNAIVLGLVKQRIMWPDDVEDGDKPMCKSPDFTNGFPNLDTENTKADKRFPIDKSNFSLADFPAERGLNGLVTLPCQSCIFSQWDKGDWKQPPCSEQHTYPLLYTLDSDEAIRAGEASYTPALFTTQRTGIKPSRTYISGFAQAGTPMFTVHTQITLDLNKRGTVEYSVPKFRRGGQTDRSMWGEYGQQMLQIRDFIRTPPRNHEEDESAVTMSSNENTAPAAAAPAAAPAEATPAPAPAAAAPAAEPTPAPAAEPVATPAAAAPAAPAPAAADDDLPF